MIKFSTGSTTERITIVTQDETPDETILSGTSDFDTVALRVYNIFVTICGRNPRFPRFTPTVLYV